MITKPYLSDIKYQHMSTGDRLLNYNRDLMLYEQTEALNRISNGSNTSNTVSLTDDSPVYELSYTLDRADYWIKKGTEERKAYDDLAKKSTRLISKSAKCNDRCATAILVFTIALCIGFPAIFIMSNQIFRIVVIGALILSSILYLVENAKLRSITQEIQDITVDINSLIPNIDDVIEEETKPKCYVRKTKKPRKEVLHLETK